jgi:hypothetical protein
MPQLHNCLNIKSPITPFFYIVLVCGSFSRQRPYPVLIEQFCLGGVTQILFGIKEKGRERDYADSTDQSALYEINKAKPMRGEG